MADQPEFLAELGVDRDVERDLGPSVDLAALRAQAIEAAARAEPVPATDGGGGRWASDLAAIAAPVPAQPPRVRRLRWLALPGVAAAAAAAAFVVAGEPPRSERGAPPGPPTAATAIARQGGQEEASAAPLQPAEARAPDPLGSVPGAPIRQRVVRPSSTVGAGIVDALAAPLAAFHDGVALPRARLPHGGTRVYAPPAQAAGPVLVDLRWPGEAAAGATEPGDRRVRVRVPTVEVVPSRRSLSVDAATLLAGRVERERERVVVEERFARAGPGPDEAWRQAFALPLEGNVTSAFGDIRTFEHEDAEGTLREEVFDVHTGVDLAAPRHTPVRAPQQGSVLFVEADEAGGLTVGLAHGQGTFTYFRHLESVQVERGADVVEGDRLGTVGSTGSASGPHLCYGLWMHGRWIDPLSVVPPG